MKTILHWLRHLAFLPFFVSFILAAQSGNNASQKTFAYTLFNFGEPEGWRITGNGNTGNSSLKGKELALDFTSGATSVSISPTPVSMLGKITRIRLKTRGSAGDHPVSLYIQTHFMTFHKVAGKISGPNESELVIDAPPGDGWQWEDGENDGNVHGPLRLLEIKFLGNNVSDKCRLELISLSIEGTVDNNRFCLLTAGTGNESKDPAYEVNIRSVSNKTLKGTLSWTIRNWDKKELENGRISVAVSPGAVNNRYSIRTKTRETNLRFAEAIFHLDIPGQVVADADACWLAAAEPQNDLKLVENTSFGMGAYLCRYHGSELEKMGEKVKEMGAKWLREDFAWPDIEPERGKFRWAFTDSVVNTATRNGIRVYAIVAYWPAWTKAYTREGINDYIDFLKILVDHYKNQIHQWEIWNEPNIFFWQGPEEMYAELLMKSYTAIKDVDPSAQVLGISTSGIDLSFIKQMLGLQAPFDVLTIHPYRSELKEKEFISELKKASELATLPDGRKRPVWITEMGWTTYTPHNWWIEEGFLPTTLRKQAELIIRTYLSCIISGIDPKVFWYDLRNDGTDPHNFEDNIGIMNRDFSPKPAYAAYSVMTRTLGGMEYAGSPEQGNDIYSGLFRESGNGNRKVLAVWSPVTDRETDVQIDAERAVLINTIGEKYDLKATMSGDKYLVHIRLKANAPVYIVF